MSTMGRVAVALLVILIFLTLWRTGVRAGDRPSTARGMGGRGLSPGSLDPADAARHLDARIARTRNRLENQPQDTRLLLRLANLYYQRGYTRALDAYSSDRSAARQLEQGDDRHYRIWMSKALLRDEGGELKTSALTAHRGLVVERDPMRRWELLRSLARTECARGAHDRELKALEEGRGLRPGDPDVLSRLARAYGELGRPLALEETLEQAWREARRTGVPALAASGDPAPSTGATPRLGQEDRRWSSSGTDGDEWLAGLYRASP